MRCRNISIAALLKTGSSRDGIMSLCSTGITLSLIQDGSCDSRETTRYTFLM